MKREYLTMLSTHAWDISPFTTQQQHIFRSKRSTPSTMFYSTFSAATLLVSIAGSGNAAVAAERSLDPVAYKGMHPHPHPHYVTHKPADTVLAEIHARHVRRSDGLGRRQAVDEYSDTDLQEVESWYWGGGKFII
jgi:hypothetical protein